MKSLSGLPITTMNRFSFICMIPDWNQILKKLNGKINLWNLIKFVWYKKMRVITRARILIMGVVPKFQGTGLESAVFWHLDNVMKRKLWYNQVELSWVGDFNPKMVAIYMSVGGVARQNPLYDALFV